MTQEIKNIADVTANFENKRVWLAFSGQTDMPFLFFLRRGFRHCFVLIHDGKQWISIDPMAHFMEVIVHHADGDFDFPAWLVERGYTVTPARFECDVRKAAPFMPFTCVEACKRALGIRKAMIFTPWQLYKYVSGVRKVRGTGRCVITRFCRFMSKIIQKGKKIWEA